MQIENLESRRMLSASLSAAGVLTVTGTAAADEIVITRDIPHHQLVVKQELRGGGGESTTRFDFAKVKSLVVNAGAGNDEVVLGAQLPIAALINGGDGDDELFAVDNSGHDTINGGGNSAVGDQAFIDHGDIVTAVEHVKFGLPAGSGGGGGGGSDDGPGHH